MGDDSKAIEVEEFDVSAPGSDETFMNGVLAKYPSQELHVILDNLNTHKPKHDRWLARHKNIQRFSKHPRATYAN